ncbi:sensor histidine kinase [Pseudonocardia acidicola]|uniref:histidine kinase n=1 Tax=Pseudonocardia acidicola TaxID=2724939 RepID=A0ABX1SJ95_9PSEU|nr:ATP-binding protein [Pseudonocardia acidicola]NMI00588.1 HAMP domain-containing protein [Pseudonocardia acidicola]
MRAPAPVRSQGRTLRARLVATVLILLALACAVIGVVTALALRQSLIGQLDDDLRSATQRFAHSAMQHPPGSQPPPPSGDYLGPGQVLGTLGARIQDGQVVGARVSNRGGEYQALDPMDYPALLAVRPGAHPVSVSLSNLGSYRMAAVTAPDGSTLVVGLPEARSHDVLNELVTIELVVIGLTLLGAGVAGAVLVRRELRPLERVAETAAKVSALPLDRGEVELVERVPNVDPATEVGQVGAALNRMLDNVGGALEARQESEMRLRQFIADASHELRTPLAAIRGYAELTRRDGPAVPRDTAYALIRISSQAERMTTLVEDLLLLARLDAGRPLERAPVDLTRLVLDAVSDAHAAGPGHRWQLALPDEPVTILGDGSRLAQVLANLLANARTHTPPGTSVTVGLAQETDNGGGAVLTVSDTGPGIPAALLPHIFERFARGEKSRSRAQGSTGLGLAIVHAVVAAHRGAVGVRSVPGLTEFTVRLPGGGLGAADAPDHAAPAGTPV